MIANAGGVNPLACAREVVRLAPGLKVAVVLGDDVYPRIDEFLAKGYEMRDMDTGEPIAAHSRSHPERQRLHRRVSRWRGAGHRRRRGDRRPLHRYRAHAGAHGPPLRLARRTSSTNSPPAPSPATSSNAARSAPAATARWIGRTFRTWRTSATPSWRPSPTDRSASPSIAAAGGRVTLDTVKEQLLYELGDPKNYITPDCVADFTSIRLEDDGARPRARQAAFAAVRARPR